jgi:hypothetical protein
VDEEAIDTLFAPDVGGNRIPAFAFQGIPFFWLRCRVDLRGAGRELPAMGATMCSIATARKKHFIRAVFN